MIRKFLTSVAVAGLVAGAANALGVENAMPGVEADEQYPLANGLDFTATSGSVDIEFGPSAGSLPAGQLLLFVDVTGGTFDGALDGTEVVTGAVNSVSTGGADGGNSVVFIIDQADSCAPDATADGAAETGCEINLPLDLTGDDVTFSIGLETTDNNPVDNSSSTDRETITVVDVVDTFSVAVVADDDSTDSSTAILGALLGPFLSFDGDVQTSLLGTIAVGANSVAYNMGTPIVANINLTGTDVSVADADEVNLTISGTMDPFDVANGFELNGTDLTVDVDDDEATDDIIGEFDTGAQDVTVTADGTTAITRSDYDVTVEITPDGTPIVTGQTFNGSLQPISRDGTTIVFPWTQTSTQGAATGTVSVFRIGNLDSSATGSVFAEVRNASEAGFVNPGITEVSTSIAGGDELVTTSTALEALLGNYGRGDVEFTIEAQPDTLTGRQFVVRGDVIQQVQGGTIDEDLSNP